MTAPVEPARFTSFVAHARMTPTRESKAGWARVYSRNNERSLSISEVEKWHRPPVKLGGTGRKNPTDYYCEGIDESIAADVPFWDAIAGIQYMCRRYGGEFVLQRELAGDPLALDWDELVAQLGEDTAGLIAHMIRSMSDGVLDPDERLTAAQFVEKIFRVCFGIQIINRTYTQ